MPFALEMLIGIILYFIISYIIISIVENAPKLYKQIKRKQIRSVKEYWTK